MDITDTLAPTSDQLDAVDLLSGPRTFTVTKVDVNKSAEQPVSVHLAEFPRVWRPGKSMRRVLGKLWGVDSSAWAGRRVELYCDETVKFGGEVVGGTRISRMSHIDGPQTVPLLITRGKSKGFTVQPLPDVVPDASDVLAAVGELMEKAAITEKDARLAYVNDVLKPSKPITSAADLTRDQASRVLDALRQDMGTEGES